jgi:CBS domain containing-hemolysin-like protein
MLWNFLLILLLVALNGFFVATEFAVITARKTRVRLQAEEGETIMLADGVQLQVASMDRLRISKVQIQGV